MNKVWLSIGIIVGIMVCSSCDKRERTILTTAERELVDSLYSKRVPYVRRQADSICDATYQEIFDSAADSIKQAYIREIREIVEGEG